MNDASDAYKKEITSLCRFNGLDQILVGVVTGLVVLFKDRQSVLTIQLGKLILTVLLLILMLMLLGRGEVPRCISYDPVHGILAVACPLQRIRLYRRCQPSLRDSKNMLDGRYGQGQQVANDTSFEIISIINTDNAPKGKLKAVASNRNSKTDKKVSLLLLTSLSSSSTSSSSSSSSRVRKLTRVLSVLPMRSWRSLSTPMARS